MRANNPTPGIQSSYVNFVLPIFMLIKFVEVEVEVSVDKGGFVILPAAHPYQKLSKHPQPL